MKKPAQDSTQTIYTSVPIAIGKLDATARGIHITAPGTLVFIDGAGVSQTRAAADFNAATIYPYQVKEVVSGTATGWPLY